VCTLEALRSVGVSGLGLKWPNDVVSAQGKLGGILIEMRAESAGPVHVVVGIGLNVMLDDAARAAVRDSGNTADDLCAHCTPAPDRNAIAAALLERLLPALARFPAEGFTPWLARWHECDLLAGREVSIDNAGESLRGVARGVDAHGALLVESPAGVRRFISGEVTVRPSA
jgi:BirA family biotin operon repressor/biotin-[acetyl-CoA-carboxylase] ligase